MSANAAIRFKLKEPTAYFSNPQTIELLKAALAGDLREASRLVAAGADPNEEGPTQDASANRLRLLHYAIASNNQAAVRILVTVGADPELSAQNNGRAFLFAITLNNTEMLTLLLDLRPVKSLSQETIKLIMFESVRQRRPECIRSLLAHGAPIDQPDGADYTILMRAMNVQDFDLAEYLLAKGASVNIETESGVTPAYQVQRMMNQFEPGTQTYLQLQRIQKVMMARGIHFPVPGPEEVREARGSRGKAN